jgi:hypothetical protein
MLACGRGLWAWAIPLGLADTNPFVYVKDLDLLDRGHVPWPCVMSNDSTVIVILSGRPALFLCPARPRRAGQERRISLLASQGGKTRELVFT